MNRIVFFLKKSILLFLFLIADFAFCQTNQLKEIDNLILKSYIYSKKYNDIKDLEYGKKANVLAIKINNSERKSKSYYSIARALFNLGLQKESLEHIQKAVNEGYTQKDPLTKALIMEIKAYNYNSLNLTSQQIKELEGILKLLKNENENEEIVELKTRTYTNLALLKPDSTFIFYKQEGELIKKLPENEYYLAISEYYLFLGSAYLKNKKLDSSYYYFQKSCTLKEKHKDPVLYMQYNFLGDYYNQQQKYDKALQYYLKAIQNMQQYSIKLSERITTYESIIKIYKILGDKKNLDKYEPILYQITDKILTDQKDNINHALNIILSDEQNKHQKSDKKSYLWISFAVSILIISFFVMYRILRKKLKHKEDTIALTRNLLKRKEQIISKINIETKELQLKVNDAYQEVIELAKNNDPSFYFRFQEVYPEFQKKTLEVIPGLRTSELILCAYIFLGFNTKYIAEYTFKSINTIRNRKQNLRRKFNISSEEDLGIWLKNLTEKKS